MHSQPHFDLYFDRWNADDDFILMEYMLTHQVKAEIYGVRVEFDDAFIDDIYGDLTEEFDYYHSKNSIKKRMAFFKKQYETFNIVKDYLGSMWEVADEYVRATTEAWVEMIRVWFEYCCLVVGFNVRANHSLLCCVIGQTIRCCVLLGLRTRVWTP